MTDPASDGSLRKALASLRANLETWAKHLASAGAFDARDLESLLARTNAAQRLASDHDALLNQSDVVVDLLAVDIKSLEAEWLSVLERLARLSADSPSLDVLREGLERARKARAAKGPPDAKDRLAALAESLAEIAGKVGAIPPSPLEEEAKRLRAELHAERTRAESLAKRLEETAAETHELAGSVRKRLAQEAQTRAQLQKKLDAAEGERERLSRENDEARDRVRGLEGRLAQEVDARSSVQGRLIAAEKFQQNLAHENGELRERLKATETKLGEELGEARRRLAEVENRLAQEILAHTQLQASASAEQASHAGLAREAADAARRAQASEGSLAEATLARAQLEAKLRAADESRERLEKTANDAQSGGSALRDRLAAADARIAQLTKDVELRAKQVTDLEGLASLAEKLEESERKLSQESARISRLEQEVAQARAAAGRGDASLREQLDKANARVAKLTEELEARLKNA